MTDKTTLAAEYAALQSLCIRLITGETTPDLILVQDGRRYEIAHDDGDSVIPLIQGLTKHEATQTLKALRFRLSLLAA